MIIVTGGAGFIGSNIVRALNDKGQTDIFIVDDLATGDKFKNLVGLQYRDYLHKDEFLQRIQTNDYDKARIEAVFHEGACSDTMEYDCNYMMANNYDYSKTLLHFCLTRRIPFLYASSASTYGDGQNGFRENRECESALNIYAFSKLSFDRYVRQYLASAQSQIVGLRYFNVFGPQEKHKDKMASITYQLYQQRKSGSGVRLFTGTDGYQDGEQQRDFVYVKDVVKVNLWFFEHNAPSGIYNCGTGRARSFNAIAKAVLRHFGSGNIEYVEFPEILRGKYQNFTQADLTQLLAAGYDKGFHSLEDAVEEYCRFLDRGDYFGV